MGIVLPFTSTDEVHVLVMPMRGTSWMYVPFGLPGSRPMRCSSRVKYATALASPGVPGLRPSKPSADSARM